MGTIKMNEYEMNDIASYLERTSQSVGNTSNEISSNFAPLNRAGLFAQGINGIKNNISKVSSSISSLKNIVINETDKMKTLEQNLANKASQIEVPRDFIVNDTATVYNYNEKILDKQDGKSVNEGLELKEENIEFNSSIEYNKKLSNIFNDNKILENKLNDYDLNNIRLNNIRNGNNLERQIYDDNSIIAKENLYDVQNNNNLVSQNIDNSTLIARETLKNINNGLGEVYESES